MGLRAGQSERENGIVKIYVQPRFWMTSTSLKMCGIWTKATQIMWISYFIMEVNMIIIFKFIEKDNMRELNTVTGIYGI